MEVLKVEQPDKLVLSPCEFARTRIVEQAVKHPLSHRQFGPCTSHYHCSGIVLRVRKQLLEFDSAADLSNHFHYLLERHQRGKTAHLHNIVIPGLIFSRGREPLKKERLAASIANRQLQFVALCL